MAAKPKIRPIFDQYHNVKRIDLDPSAILLTIETVVSYWDADRKRILYIIKSMNIILSVATILQ